jgi:hypothetical protein
MRCRRTATQADGKHGVKPTFFLIKKGRLLAMPFNAATPPPIEWRFIRAADRPIPEDIWIDSVFQTEVQRQHWRAWLARPRFAVAVNVGPWAAIAVAFQESVADNALLELFRNIDTRPRANAWAVDKATGQIFRLATHLPPEATEGAGTGAEARVAEPNAIHPVARALLGIPAEAWQNPSLRARWEAHLVVSNHWLLSQCHRRLSRSNHAGEFASFQLDDQLSHIGSLFENVMEIDTLPRSRYRQLYARLHRRERILDTAVVKTLLATVDADCLRQLRQARIPGGVSAVSLNWLVSARGSAVGIVSIEFQARRLQAIVAAPLLIPWLLGDRRRMRLGFHDDPFDNNLLDSGVDSEAAFPHRAHAISNAVDGGEPLYPLLARLTGLSLRTVRHLRLSELRLHHLIERMDHGAGDQVLSRLRWLDVIAVEQWPRTPTAWQLWANVIKELCSQCDLVTDLIAQPLPLAMVDRVPAEVTSAPLSFGRGATALSFYTSLAARRWRLRMGPVYDMPDDDGTAGALMMVGMELRDFVRALREAAFDDIDDLGEPMQLSLPLAVSDLLRQWNIEDWWSASVRWHAALAEAGVAPEAHGGPSFTERDAVPWLALLEDPFFSEDEHDDIREVRAIRFLQSADALNVEADTMRHCIRAYSRQCVTGRWHIASLVDGEGARCSTAAYQLRFEKGRWTAALVEHRGPKNARASAPCAQAVRALETTLANPVMQGRYVELEAARVARAAAWREHRAQSDTRAQAVSLTALRAALPINVCAALVGARR